MFCRGKIIIVEGEHWHKSLLVHMHTPYFLYKQKELLPGFWSLVCGFTPFRNGLKVVRGHEWAAS